MKSKSSKSSWLNPALLWDIWCCISVIGIWPRFIEPRLLATTKLTITLDHLPSDLDGIKILQFTDLHLHRSVSDDFLNKIIRKIQKLAPDLIVFTGDFLCFAHLNQPERLAHFLSALKAPYGCFAILGNHDYAECVSINNQGEYDVLEATNKSQPIKKGFARLFKKIRLTKTITPRAQSVTLNAELIDLLSSTPFELLHNKTKVIPVRQSYLNVCGLGEYMADRFNPAEAFLEYDSKYPGIILSHNPDTGPKLTKYPGEIILSGHTHGGQINLPWIWKKVTLLENMNFKKGLWKLNDKWMYVSRGVGSVFDFRWFSMPEIVLLTLKKKHEH